MTKTTRIHQNLSNFSGDKRGVAAIEFALLAPLLIGGYMAMVELTLGFMASQRTSHVAAMIGDLVAQNETISTAEINDIFSITSNLMAPLPTGTNFKVRLSNISKGSNNIAKVTWSRSSNTTEYATNQVINNATMTALAASKSLVMTEITYEYDSPIGQLLPGTSVFTYIFYHRPRSDKAVFLPAT
jgi:Flp pilus assembly protein TadG